MRSRKIDAIGAIAVGCTVRVADEDEPAARTAIDDYDAVLSAIDDAARAAAA